MPKLKLSAQPKCVVSPHVIKILSPKFCFKKSFWNNTPSLSSLA